MEAQIIFGDQMMPVNLPEDVRSAPPGLSTSLPAVDDIEETVRKALQNPLVLPPLSDLAKPEWKVTIVFVKYPMLVCRQ
jgi:hypothetical protein